MSLFRNAVLVVSLSLSSLALAADPVGAPSLAAPASAAPVVALFPGWAATLPAENVARYTVEDASIATVARNDKGGVIVSAAKEGRTRVTVWLVGAAVPRTFEVRVDGAGWELVPVLTATVDIREDSVLTDAMVTVRYVPRALVTSSIAKPDALKYLLHQPIGVPVQAGDLLLWSEFEHRIK